MYKARPHPQLTDDIIQTQGTFICMQCKAKEAPTHTLIYKAY